MKKYLIFLAGLLACLSVSFDAVSQCTPGTNYRDAKLLYLTEVALGNDRVEADTEYYLQVTLDPPMDADMVISVLVTADGFGYLPGVGGTHTYIPPSVGKDTGPTSYSRNILFRIHTAPDPADIGADLYFSMRAECDKGGSTRTKGSLRQFSIRTNR
jgi:hypothetical protein